MAINEHAEIFFGQEVRQYNGVADWKGPNYAYRLGVDYDASQGKLEGLLDQLAEQRDVGKLTALIIGFWGPGERYAE